MRIEEFRKHFVGYIDECNKSGIPATIHLYNNDSIYIEFDWVVVSDYKIVGNKMILLTTGSWDSDNAYKFTDKTIFDDISEVTFMVEDKEITDAIETFGFVTSENRNHLNLPKDHYIDACIIASGGLEFKELGVIFYKRRVSKGDYQLTKGIRGEQKLPTGKIYGFRKFDKVEYLGGKYFIKGRMNSGFAILMNIFSEKVDFSSMPKGLKTPKLSNCNRISARRSCLCISQIRKERAIHILS